MRRAADRRLRNSPALGGPGYVADWTTATSGHLAADYSIAAQVWVQARLR